MKITFLIDGKENELNLQISQHDNIVDVDLSQQFRRGKEGLLREEFDFVLDFNAARFGGRGTFGNEALWLPLAANQVSNNYESLRAEKGLKIIREVEKGTIDQVLENIKYIQKINSPIFPKISFVTKGYNGDNPCIVIEMENVEYHDRPILSGNETYLPIYDKYFIESIVQSPLQDMATCIKEFTKYHLCPDDDWYKNLEGPTSGYPNRAPSRNLISGKIVDFHNFRHMPERYIFPSGDTPAEQVAQVYNNALIRYKKWEAPELGGLAKWKGKIYQGMKFDNGYEMAGYSSDGLQYDSFVKLPFIPLNKIKNKKVLDLGSNQGFYSIQAALHGASSVLGVELTEEDVLLANEIRSLMPLENIDYKLGDIVEHIKNDKNEYEMIILNSVLHQIYPEMKGSEEFLNNVASRCQYFVFETPANHHKLMGMPLEQIYGNLVKIFKDPNRVRLLYVYDAYSTGYRANFVCYTHG